MVVSDGDVMEIGWICRIQWDLIGLTDKVRFLDGELGR